MRILEGNSVFLRALEPTDLAFLYQLENDSSIWEVSQTHLPFSKTVLKQYLENATESIYKAEQLRLAIILKSGEIIGCVDLYDFNAKNSRAGIGIVISQLFRGQGFAFEALQLLEEYAVKVLNIHQLYAEIPQDNFQSVHLFEKLNFQQNGIKKDWIFSQGKYKNVAFYQKIYNF